MTSRTLLISAAIMMATAIALGAFGAHAWQDTLNHYNTQAIFNTASQYHFYHSLAMLCLGIYAGHKNASIGMFVPFAIILGTCIFSGSLYILALSNLRWLGAITPIGGTLLIAAWLYWITRLIRHKT